MSKFINLALDRNPMRKVYVIILDLTSFPLLIGAYLILLSGYCLTKTNIVKQLTLGLLEDVKVCSILHLEELQVIIAVLALIHTIAGTNVMLSKFIKNRLLLDFSETIVLIIGLVLMMQIVLIFML
ncbi:MAG: hypothetical protein ACP5IZ_01180 [Thermoprotei archaeon]